MKARASMNAAVRTILGLTLLAIAAAVLLVGVGVMTGQVPGAAPMSAGAIGGPGFEYGGYLILVLVNVGLGTVVAWMLFGERE